MRVRLRPPKRSGSHVSVGRSSLLYENRPMPLPPRKAVRPFSGSSQREMRRSKRFESVYAHQIKAVHSSEWAVLFYVRRWTPCRLIKRKHEQDNAPK